MGKDKLNEENLGLSFRQEMERVSGPITPTIFSGKENKSTVSVPICSSCSQPLTRCKCEDNNLSK